MKKLFLLYCILRSFDCYSADEGKMAPAFEAKLFNGEKISLEQAQNQVVILHFWASWCATCRTEMPILDNYYKQYHSRGLQIIALSMDEAKDEAKAREIMKAFSFPAAMAKEASYKKYGRIWRLPLTFVIDRKGILRKDGWVQDHSLSQADLDQVVTPLIRSSFGKN